MTFSRQTDAAMDAVQPTITSFGLSDLGGARAIDSINNPTINRSAVTDVSRHIEWASSLQEGISEAQKQGKPLVCVFEEDYCGWCKQFDQELTKPAADRLSQDAVFVKISPSKDPDGLALAQNLGISEYPTVSILDINGANISERSRMTGFVTADQFAARLAPSDTATV